MIHKITNRPLRWAVLLFALPVAWLYVTVLLSAAFFVMLVAGLYEGLRDWAEAAKETVAEIAQLSIGAFK